MRILVTGSRDWEDAATIRETLTSIVMGDMGPHTLIHGACPTGADAIADRIATGWRWQIDSHPARWRDISGALDRGAGFRRNVEMVNLLPDVVAAFIRNGSRGATHCTSVARNLHLRLVIHEVWD